MAIHFQLIRFLLHVRTQLLHPFSEIDIIVFIQPNSVKHQYKLPQIPELEAPLLSCLMIAKPVNPILKRRLLFLPLLLMSAQCERDCRRKRKIQLLELHERRMVEFRKGCPKWQRIYDDAAWLMAHGSTYATSGSTRTSNNYNRTIGRKKEAQHSNRQIHRPLIMWLRVGNKA